MTTAAILTRRASRDLAQALRTLAENNPQAATRLNDAVRDAAQLIGSNPNVGSRRLALADARYRFWSIPKYRYLLVYTDSTHPPRILRLVHTARDLSPLLSDLSSQQ